MKNFILIFLLILLKINLFSQGTMPCTWSGVGTPTFSGGRSGCMVVYHTTSDSIWVWGDISWQYIGSQSINISNSDLTLTDNRTITQNNKKLSFIGGQLSFGQNSNYISSTYPIIFRAPTNASTYFVIQSGRDSLVNGEAGIRLIPSGEWGSTLEWGTPLSKGFNFYSHALNRSILRLGSQSILGSARTIMVGGTDDPIQWDFNSSFVVYDSISTGKGLFVAKKIASTSTPIAVFSSAANDRFTFNDDGSLRSHTYGQGNMEASDLSKTVSNYILGLATDGTFIDVVDKTIANSDLALTGERILSFDPLDRLLFDFGGGRGFDMQTGVFTLNFVGVPATGEGRFDFIISPTTSMSINPLTYEYTDTRGGILFNTTNASGLGNPRIDIFYTAPINIIATGSALSLSGSNINVGNTTTSIAGQLRLLEASANGSNYINIASPTALSANYTMTLPTSIGSNGQVLTTNGTSSLSWSNMVNISNTDLTLTANRLLSLGSFSYTMSNSAGIAIEISNTAIFLYSASFASELSIYSDAAVGGSRIDLLSSGVVRIDGVANTVTSATSYTISSPYTLFRNPATSPHELRLNESTANGSNYIGLVSPNNLSANILFTLPATIPATGGTITTNSSGVMAVKASQDGVISTTTDASGDITITFGSSMPDATYTTITNSKNLNGSYSHAIHSETSSSFKIRTYSSGSALAAGVTVTYSWMVTDN